MDSNGPVAPMGEHASDRFRQMVEAGDEICFFERGMDLRLTYVSPSCKKITGYEQNQLIGRKVSDFLASAGGIGALDFSPPPEIGQPCRREAYVVEGRHKNGSVVVAEVSEVYCRDAEGNLVVRGFLRDITAKRAVERQLELSDEILRRINAIVAVANGQGQIVYVSPSTTRLLGFSAAELLGYGWWRHKHRNADISRQGCEDIAATARGERPCRNGIWEETAYDKDGNQRSLLWQEAKGPGDLLIGIAQDITEKKKTDEELSRRSTQLRAIFDNASEGIFIVNDEFRYVDVNPAGCAIFGSTREQILGQPVGTFSPANSLSPELWRKIRCQGSYAGEHQILRRDGTPVDVEISVQMSILPGLHLAMLRDITARKRLEAQFLHSQKMEAVGRLAGGVAHDVNNMLMAIRGYGELLQLKLKDNQGAGRYTENILDAVDRAAMTTRQLLAFSRQQVVQPQSLNLNTVVVEMAKLLQRSIGEDIRLELSLDSGLGDIKADPGEIGQVLLNLAINAKDAMPNGGSLHIATSNVRLDSSYLQSHLQTKTGDHVLLNVTDTGCGMDAETTAKIFEPFFTTKAPGKGTGLGLPTAYGIVKQAGGFIYVYSEPGQGTSFKVYFPRTDVVTAPVPVSDFVLSGSRTILVMDDDGATNAAIAEYLRSQGYSVLQAMTGLEALDICRKKERFIDAVVSDVTMPGTDGQDLLGVLSIHQPEAKMIYISGFSHDSLQSRGILPANALFLQKPFPFEHLRRELEHALSLVPAGESLQGNELWKM